MRKTLTRLAKVITVTLRMAPACLLAALLGGLFEYVADTIVSIVFLLLIMAEALRLAHEIWDGARFELALDEVAENSGDGLQKVTALEPLPNVIGVSKASVIVILTGVALCKLFVPMRMIMLICAGGAGLVLLICLLALDALYGQMWLKRQRHGDKTLQLEISYRWAPGEDITVKVLGPTQLKHFRLHEKKTERLPFYFSGL